MNDLQGRIVVITGASSGIGAETVKILAQHGAHLVIGARRVDRMDALVSELGNIEGQVIVKQTDVTKQADIDSLIRTALDKFGRIDVLINNAGLMPLSFLSQTKVDEWEQMIDVNLKGVLYGIAAVIGPMKLQQSGHIINIASIAGHSVFATGSVYCATKHAVRALSEGLRQEEPHIRTTVISPGAVDTELPNAISDKRIGAATQEMYQQAISATKVAESIAWTMAQPANVDVNEIVIRPVSQSQ
ncbi:oxidoreductase [Veronia nyctiphanis]|uniref:Oxidoreductase n=1 Tax=Veronia nyctiphanis TaxID=1278244 RepID=A0A4V1LSS7_9GAMM|nr:SDR family oxidoreductase [Veronia nyctiphanis]RXJ72738.1 oxidoreductase [Veronia nyctiphanis]